MDIGIAKDNFNKDRKPKCFNCNIWIYDKRLLKAKERKRITVYRMNQITKKIIHGRVLEKIPSIV